MTEKKTTTTAQKQPDGIITTQRNGQTIVAELFFNHIQKIRCSGDYERDKLLKAILADYSHFSASDGQEP